MINLDYTERLADLISKRKCLIKHRDKLDPSWTRDVYQDAIVVLTEEIYRIETIFTSGKR